MMRRFLVASLIVFAACCHAQKPGDVMRFAFQRSMPAGAEQYAIVMGADGNGRVFEGDAARAGAEEQTAGAQVVHAGAATLHVLFAPAKAVLSGRCESRHKVADTGTKTLALIAGDRSGQCTFNYSDDEKVNSAAAAFIAMHRTLELGVKLKELHRFDRLGLDAVMMELVRELGDNTAAEPGNIRVELKSIASDDAVLERVRRQAATLLEQVQAGERKDASSAAETSAR